MLNQPKRLVYTPKYMMVCDIIKEIIMTLEQVTNKPKSYTYTTFEKVAYEDSAVGG